MDRLLQWAWDRYGARYSWIVTASCFAVALPVYLFMSCAIVASEHSGCYLAGVGATGVAMLLLALGIVLPGLGPLRLVERWAAGDEADSARALEATYTWARAVTARGLPITAVCSVVLSLVVGVLVGATELRLVEYAVMACIFGTGSHLIGVHGLPETPMRPVRIAIVGDTGMGDELPRSRPTFAAWSNISMLAMAFAFSMFGAITAAVFDRNQTPSSG